MDLGAFSLFFCLFGFCFLPEDYMKKRIFCILPFYYLTRQLDGKSIFYLFLIFLYFDRTVICRRAAGGWRCGASCFWPVLLAQPPTQTSSFWWHKTRFLYFCICVFVFLYLYCASTKIKQKQDKWKKLLKHCGQDKWENKWPLLLPLQENFHPCLSQLTPIIKVFSTKAFF